MSGIEWLWINQPQTGLAVEGVDDKIVIEAMLDAGQPHHWVNWRSKLQVVAAGNSTKVLDEVGPDGDPRVWGLIDRDWRTDEEIDQLTADHPRLLILPRIMIENYLIDPTEILAMLPVSIAAQLSDLHSAIESHLDEWIENGALWQVLYEGGAFEFCRGHEQGYPMALLHSPLNETDMRRQFAAWYTALDPNSLLRDHAARVKVFRADPDQHYTRHIHGKNFFNAMVVSALNKSLTKKQQRSANEWFEILFTQTPLICPPDIIPILQRIVT